MPDVPTPRTECVPPIAVPREPFVIVSKVHPALEKMARGICRAEGHAEDEHWFDYDPKAKVDRGGPAWTNYLDHAEQALKVLETLDFSTLMRGTAAINWDNLPPADDEGDTDYVPDLDRMMKALVHHILRQNPPPLRPTTRTTWDERHILQRQIDGEWVDAVLGGAVAEFYNHALAVEQAAALRQDAETYRVRRLRTYSLTEETVTVVA